MSSRRHAKKVQEYEVLLAEKRARRIQRAQKDESDRDLLFGPIVPGGTSKPSEPAQTSAGADGKVDSISETGMGIKGEGGGLLFAGQGLRDVGMELDSSDESD